MADKRIIELNTVNALTEDDYVMIDNATNGTGKVKATLFGGSSGIDYSTTEQNTGLKWIDGKPIYQKTYHFTESSAIVEKDYDITADNVDFMISCVGCIKFGLANKWYTIPRLSGGNYIAMISANNTEITVGAREYTYIEAYVTIQYTKTTDVVS